MGFLPKASIAVLAAVCLLLAAGGFPLMGAPAVYKGGMMLILAALAALLALWGGWRLAKGRRAQFVFGLVSVFLATAGLVAVWQFGTQAAAYARIGGAMWFGAAGMASLALVGLLFTAIFGFFMLKLMDNRLWLAGAHWSFCLLAAGAGIDYCGEVSCPLWLPANGSAIEEAQAADGTKFSLGFKLQAEDFGIERYDDAPPAYTLYQWTGGKWNPIARPNLQNGRLIHGQESWPANSLQKNPFLGSQPYVLLQGEPARLLMQDEPAVRSYHARCRVTSSYRGREEAREETLRVNEPISCNGWRIYLMGYRPMGGGALLQLEARRAPGRLPALAGMVGLIICCAFWCWGKPKPRDLAPRM